MNTHHEAPAELDARYDGSTGSVHRARSDVRDWMEQIGATASAMDHAQLVTSELASNAVQAAPGKRYQLLAERSSPDTVTVCVINTAPDSPHLPARSRWEPDDPLAEKGRGLLIVHALARRVDVDESTDGVIRICAELAIE